MCALSDPILSYFIYPSNLSMLVIAKGGKPSVSQASRHVPNPGVVMKIPWAMGPNPGVPSLGAGTPHRDTNLRQELIFLARFNRKFIFHRRFFFETCLLFSFLNVEPIFWATEKPGKPYSKRIQTQCLGFGCTHCRPS